MTKIENHKQDLESEKVWGLCSELIKIFAEEAPTNDPQEFLPFCGAYGIGAIGSVSPQYFEQALSTLKMLANDFRWRMREAVCFGLQRMMRKRSHDVLKRLETWIGDGSLLQLRAVIAAVADPPLLKNKQLATIALRLHKRIINSLHHLKERKFEDFRTLKKALGFTLSVVVCEIPETGFKFMHELVNSTDPDIRWIVTDNLKKNRLIKDFPEQVELLKKQL